MPQPEPIRYLPARDFHPGMTTAVAVAGVNHAVLQVVGVTVQGESVLQVCRLSSGRTLMVARPAGNALPQYPSHVAVCSTCGFLAPCRDEITERALEAGADAGVWDVQFAASEAAGGAQ